MKKLFLFIVSLLFAGLGFGCSTVALKSSVSPGVNLAELKTYYVVHLPQDGRRVDKMIADRLNLMGRHATWGEKSATPDHVDAVITYQDKWMWDITMYMVELNVQVRHPKTEITLASGHSLRTSLVRKSPPEMVKDVLAEMLKQ